MLVVLSNGSGSSPCIYHTEDNFYQQYPYIWGINQSSWFNIYQWKSQKGDRNGTVSNINNNNKNCLKSNIQCIEIRVQWTMHLGSSHMHVHAVTPKLVICVMYLTSILTDSFDNRRSQCCLIE